ncbi:MAG: hypothetical protein HY763_14100 [Planctomycetes bacterium]|nr:hypothetical protein [Planctomycetota bacterium]
MNPTHPSSSAAATPPDLSIVIGVIAGGYEPTATCLATLEPEIADYRVECLVPYDGRLGRVEELAKRFPWATFIDARDQVDDRCFGASSREHHDILRAIGLNGAQGRIVALLEDHGTPAPGWCRSMVEAHQDTVAGVGGAVENGVDRLLNWAVYFCDFGRYQNPVPTGPSDFMSDSNCSYKREALEQAKEHWKDAFHETLVNWELRRKGHVLRLDPGMTVYQTRRGLRLGAALYERYVWGRSFAGTRVKEVSSARRAILAGLSFVLPLVLTWRILSRGLKKGRHTGKLLAALPLIFLLETVWSWGEFVGYVTARASRTG